MKITVKIYVFKVVVILLFLTNNNVQSQNIFTLKLKTLDGKEYKLSDTKKSKAVVYIFISPDNSLCQKYSITLNEQQKLFVSKKIKYIGIICGKQYTIQEINHFKKIFNIQFDLLVDESYDLQKNLGATVTPEAFLVSNLGKTIYSGRIDDWAHNPEKTKATVHNLKDAVNSYLASKSVKIKKTKAVGISIE